MSSSRSRKGGIWMRCVRSLYKRSSRNFPSSHDRKIFVRGEKESRIRGFWDVRTQGKIFLFIQEAQELYLRSHADVADLIQKQGSSRAFSI